MNKNVKNQKLSQKQPTASTSSADQGNIASMGSEAKENAIVEPSSPGPSTATSGNEKTTQTSDSCCNCEARIRQLMEENDRLFAELLAQQWATVCYNENCAKLQEDLKKTKFTFDNLNNKQLKTQVFHKFVP